MTVNPAMTGYRIFEAFLPFQQSPVYAGAATACGARVRVIDLGIGQALALERGLVRLVSRGPVWQGAPSPDLCRRALRRLARWPGLTLVTPSEPLSGCGLVPLVTPMHHALWDLSGDLRGRMAGKWRNRLVAAERAGLAVTAGDAATLADLVAQEAAQRALRRYRSLPAGFTRALPPEALRLWEWRQAGRLEAAMCFVRHGASASYHLGWGSGLARKAGVHALMLARAAEALQAEGVRWLDLGTVNSEDAPGLARFKLGTGATLRQLGATLLVLP